MTLFAMKGVKTCVGYIILLSILATVCYSCPEGYYGPTCNLLRSCEPVPPPQNAAIITCNTTYLSPCVMRCNEGYKSTGSSERQCIVGSSDNMIWTGSPLLCEATECPALPLVMAATVYPAQCQTGPVVFDTVCSYICADGYGVNKNPTQQSGSLVCKIDGTWTEQLPRCEDFSPPRLTCPSDMVVTNDKGQATATVSWSVNVSDNSVDVEPHAVNMIAVLSSHQSPFMFPIGPNIVKVTGTDGAGNTEDCVFFIEVRDNEPPMITCPGDIAQNDLTVAKTLVTWDSPNATDNSGDQPILTSTRPSGDVFAVPGLYEIVYTAQDNSGNKATCSFRITLEKKTCPLYPPPANGALACSDAGADPYCMAMCRSGFDFNAPVPFLYLCASGVWQTIGFIHGVSFPWPNCTASSGNLQMGAFPQFYYSDANDPSVVDTEIKNNFITLVQAFNLRPTEESVKVYLG